MKKWGRNLVLVSFFLVDTVMKIGRQKVFNYQMSMLDNKLINEIVKEVFNILDFAAKFNIAMGCVLRVLETG